jgi:cyclopropane-fatty-acyl-phospholipid synthase
MLIKRKCKKPLDQQDNLMKKTNGKQVIQELFDFAGVRIDGNRPWDIRIRNPQFFERVLAGGSLALGESYMDGWWDCDALDQFF